ncbi:MAG: Nif3-like dinuclear metal center hexameric protein [Coriobacteriaceae bacterium]|nr:Nif3-like dinuclear metal center hexameric protein [Coriobacteriaceae bacterium]
MNVRELERSLLEAFPRSQAEPWDRVGLTVGNPLEEVAGVAVALDATTATIRAAKEHGANVLLTHHPLYIQAPEAFTPELSEFPSSGSALYEAIRLGVSVISLHTNLDRSFEARACLPNLLGLSCESSLEFSQEPERPGLGSLCVMGVCTLTEFAQHLERAFETSACVWGDPTTTLRRAAFLGGSLGDFGELAICAGADAIVTGEAGYHRALDLSARGLSVITLGHDRSEQPFCSILSRAATKAGVPEDSVYCLPVPANWWVPTKEASDGPRL